MSNHPIVHVDFPAKNTEATAKFYEQAFGWQLIHEPTFDYWMFSIEGGPGGGFVSTGTSYIPDAPEQYEIGKPMVYLGSEDIDADLAHVEASGGRIIVPRTSLGEFGAFAIFADPDGNHLGFYHGMASTT